MFTYGAQPCDGPSQTNSENSVTRDKVFSLTWRNASQTHKAGYLFGRFMFNCTFSTNRLYGSSN